MQKQTKPDRHLPPVVLSEINFLTLPFFNLARKGLGDVTSVEYTSSIQRNGETVNMFWKVSANSEFGFPGPFDKEVHKSIEALITKQGYPVSNPIDFSLYELCILMDITPSGKNMQAIKDALTRIVATTVVSKHSFYSKASERWIERVFHLYDDVTFKGESRPDNHEIADTNYLYLGKWFLDNLNAFYIKSLDYDFYKCLKNPVDKRYYEIMSVKFYGAMQSKISFLRYRYSTLCSLFPLTQQPYLSLAKQKLNPAHKRLKKKGFFSKVSWHKTNDKNDWLLYFYPGPKAHDLLNPQKALSDVEIDSLGSFDEDNGQMEFSFEADAVQIAKNSPDNLYKLYKIDNNNKEPQSEKASEEHPVQSVVALLGRLKEYKIPEKLAVKYLEKYPLTYLDEKIRIIEFKKSRDKRIKNSGGMLRKAIEENWQPPENLTVATEKREREIEKHERLQAEEEQAAMEEAKNKAVEEWISKASDSLVAEIQKRAAREIREENPETKDQFLRMLNKIRVKEIIAREYLDKTEII